MIPLCGISNSPEEQGMSTTVRISQFFLSELLIRFVKMLFLHTDILSFLSTDFNLGKLINTIIKINNGNICATCQIIDKQY
jgi:hypothetical protein